MNVLAVEDTAWQSLNRIRERPVDLPPIVVTELTSFGWRGLTQDGEILNVEAKSGPRLDASVVDLDGRPMGFRIIAKPTNGPMIDAYLQFYNRAAALLRANQFRLALKAINNAMRIAETTRARYTRGMILLALGRWQEGFRDYAYAESKPPFYRPIARFALDAGLKPWHGQAGKRLLLIHGHGFGDTIMMLRFVPVLQNNGIEVKLMVPPPLERLAGQFAPTTYDFDDCDYFCTILQAMGPLGVTPGSVSRAPYLEVDAALAAKWREHCRPNGRRRVGIAWSVGKYVDGDYPRPIPLALLVQHLGDVDVYSVQQQDGGAARALGVKTFTFDDFADCAAFMSTLDAIVSVDTAALHLAGAVGHPRVFGLLSHWASWRWQAAWYPQITWCQQDQPGDWDSALAKLPPL